MPGHATRRLVCAAVAFGAFTAAAPHRAPDQPPLAFSFANVARDAKLNHTTVFGGAASNKYLLETTGTGVAFIDVDDDGWLDLFFVNGTTLDGFRPDAAPTNHLYRNRGDGTFEDITRRAGVDASGWGQGV